ncbi:MAG: methyltransferase domain-containing protein [Vicinamibacterales bacterium]
MLPRLLERICCPSCQSPLASESASQLRCPTCSRTVAVRDGVPRFVVVPKDETAQRTQASFGYEWTHFNDWTLSGDTNFQDYFKGVDFAALRDRLVLDAGCGMGRHARLVAEHAGHVIAADFSAAVDQAARNLAGLPNVDCVQADLLELPVPDASIDYLYSMGVLHHLADPQAALARLVRKVKPGGRLRIYLYWKRHGWKGRVLSLVTLARRLTTRLPFGLLRAFCWLLSVVLWVGVILPYRALTAVGVTAPESWPLFVYTKYPFRILYNDQFDRFSAPIEFRYDPDEVKRLMEAVGLEDVRITASFGWIGEGVRPVR